MNKEIKIDTESVKAALQNDSGRPKILIVGSDNVGILRDLIEGEDFIVDYEHSRVSIKEGITSILAQYTAGDFSGDSMRFNEKKRRVSEVKKHKHPGRHFHERK